jgi:hypothetical protein
VRRDPQLQGVRAVDKAEGRNKLPRFDFFLNQISRFAPGSRGDKREDASYVSGIVMPVDGGFLSAGAPGI